MPELTKAHSADGTGVSQPNISKFESSSDEAPAGSAATSSTLAKALEAAGVRFVRGGVILRSSED